MKHILSAQVLAAVLRASSTPLFYEVLVTMSAGRKRAALFRNTGMNRGT
jgi:hypothetical protein